MVKQEVDVGFVQKWIPPYDIPTERMYLNIKQLWQVVAEKTVTKIFKFRKMKSENKQVMLKNRNLMSDLSDRKNVENCDEN